MWVCIRTYHLYCNVENSFEIELPPAFLEKVFKTLTEQVHDHHMEHLAILGLLVAHEVQEGNKGLAAQLVDEFGLPEKHDVLLHLDSFLLQKSRVSDHEGRVGSRQIHLHYLQENSLRYEDFFFRFS